MATYYCNNMSELRSALIKETTIGMGYVEKDLKKKLDKELKRYYTRGNPKVYVRTGALGKSGRTMHAGFNTPNPNVYVYMNPGMYHLVPNPDFEVSYFNAMQIFDATENNKYGVLGMGGYWLRTMLDVPKMLKYDLGMRFGYQ